MRGRLPDTIGPLNIFHHSTGGGLTLVWKSENNPPRPAASAEEVETSGYTMRVTGVGAIVGVVLTVVVAGAGIQLLVKESWIWGALALVAACVLAFVTVILLVITFFGRHRRPDRIVLLPDDEAEEFLAAVERERARIDGAAADRDTVIDEAARRLWNIAIDVTITNRRTAAG